MQVWIPYLKKDVDLVEAGQCRATKIIIGYKRHCYKDRLALCKSSTLEGRRLRGDLIRKLLKGLGQV